MDGYYQKHQVVDVTTYPSGESYFEIKRELARKRHVPPAPQIIIEWQARTWGDVVGLCLVDDRFRELGWAPRWFLPFLPFARDDRRREVGSTNGLDFAIDLLKKRDVLIADPHSYVSMRLPNLPQYRIVEHVAGLGKFPPNPVILVPDAGARVKVDTWFDQFFHEWVQGQKVRDPATGKLWGFAIRDGSRMKDRDVVIVDDICDGGGTFLGLEDIARQHGARTVTLVVTHGLFTSGTERLSSLDRIITFGDGPTAPNIHRLSWERLFEENFCNDE